MPASSDAALTGADRANILDLYGRYALAIDFGDGSDWTHCFTVGGRFIAHRGEGMSVLGNGLYQDTLRREGDTWLFEQRAVTHERLRP